MPIPVEGWNLRAADIFHKRTLIGYLKQNARWLQAQSRSSDEIEATLFPDYNLGGMHLDEVRSALNHALWEEGYSTSDTDSDNPTWTWEEENN